MSAAVILQIGDAVVAELNSAPNQATFAPQSFAAKRFYVPVYDVQKDLPTLQVSVVPKEQSLVPVTRNADDFTYAVDVAVQKQIGKGALTYLEIQQACDPLVLLAEQILDVFRGKPLTAVPGVQCMRAENPMLYIPSDVDQERVFSSILTFTFKLVRTRP